MKSHINEEEMGKNLRLKVRFDYQGIAKNNRFPFRTPSPEQVAEEIREQKVAMLRNVPLQGIEIEEITMSGDVYTVYDEVRAQSVAYAPVAVEFKADSIEDAIQFIMREEFRKVEIIEPDHLNLTKM
ncbi:MAG: M55 family metallopeptidase, partial [Syntrophomonadaceae bacterium]|nr:M55 family metallopeptidase [Syntrophomonadaceae bacterium]